MILTGAGKGFCSGLHIKDAMAGSGIGAAEVEAVGAAAPRSCRPPPEFRGR